MMEKGNITMKSNQELFLMTMLTHDAADATARFCGIIGRWGCSLENLVLTRDQSGNSRMTVVVGGSAHQLDRIAQQTAKLCSVREVSLLSSQPLREDETLHLLLCADSLTHAEASHLCASHGAMICGRSDRALRIEMTGSPSSLAFFLNAAAPYGILSAEVSNVSTFPVEEELLKAAY